MKEILDRIQRVYAAVGETLEVDLSKFRPHAHVTEERIVLWQDFSGGLTNEQIANFAWGAIHGLAHLTDHLRRWAKTHGKHADDVHDTIDGSEALGLVIDLSNRDKHGPSRDGGRTGLGPRLENIKRVMSISTGSQPGIPTTLEFTPTGPVIYGPGSAKIIITGDVVAEDGSRIAELYELLNEALESWESLLSGWGIR